MDLVPGGARRNLSAKRAAALLTEAGKGVEVGDLVAGDGHQVQLPVGWHRLRIYADQPGNATQLRFVFGPAPDRSQAAPPTNPRPPA